MDKNFAKYLVIAMLLVVGGAFPNVSYSQSLEFDREALVASCRNNPESCRAEVEAVISYLEASGLSVEQLNSQLGAIASAVIEAAQGADTMNFSSFGDVLATIANTSTDPAQSSAIRRAVASVSAGDFEAFSHTVATGAARGSSPG